MKNLLKWLARKAGYEVIRLHRPAAAGVFPPDFDQQAIETYVNVRPFTMTTPERVFALLRAVEYVIGNDIPGNFVECGVWKGGSMMVIARALMKANRTNTDLLLYDT